MRDTFPSHSPATVRLSRELREEQPHWGRLRDAAGKREAGATGAEQGTAFAGAEAEAGSFGGPDRGNPETPGPQRGGPGDRARGSRQRCGSAGAAEPAGSAAWVARRRGAWSSSAGSWPSRTAGERRALTGRWRDAEAGVWGLGWRGAVEVQDAWATGTAAGGCSTSSEGADEWAPCTSGLDVLERSGWRRKRS